MKRRACAKCGRNRAERFYVSARGRVCSTCRKRGRVFNTRDVHLAETKGITSAEYAWLLEVQGGCCYICGRKPNYNMDVDHDHALEKRLIANGVPHPLAVRYSIRGLLDKPCNRRLLPSIRDDVDSLRRAIDYLQHEPPFWREYSATPARAVKPWPPWVSSPPDTM